MYCICYPIRYGNRDYFLYARSEGTDYYCSWSKWGVSGSDYYATATTNMEIDEIKNIWYSLGLRGGNSENDWAIRIKFAKAIEEYLKGKK